MRVTAAVFATMVCVSLAGCTDSPAPAPDNPFYVGSGPGRAEQVPDPSVGTGHGPMGGGGGPIGSGGYLSGGAGGS